MSRLGGFRLVNDPFTDKPTPPHTCPQTLTDLNDYLGPSQACIKPVEGKDAPDAQDQQQQDESAAATQIAVESSGVYESSNHDPVASSSSSAPQPRARTKLEAAEISLNDCLACSGCVTSAESVLIGMQSVDEIRRVIEENQVRRRCNDTRGRGITFSQLLSSLTCRL